MNSVFRFSESHEIRYLAFLSIIIAFRMHSTSLSFSLSDSESESSESEKLGFFGGEGLCSELGLAL